MGKIFTKLGDQGKTSLIGEIGLEKDDLVFEVIGNIDELDASIGLVKSFLQKDSYITKLEKIQRLLFQLNSEVANRKGINKQVDLICDADIKSLEDEMDEWDAKLPELKNFIFLGSNKISALIHITRTVCRRTERSIIKYNRTEKLRPQIPQFINRLSDWLFVLARITSSEEDKIWKA